MPVIGSAESADHDIFKDGHSCRYLYELKGPADPFPVRLKGLESCDFLPFEITLPESGL